MNLVKKIVQWVLTAVLAVFALLWMPSLSSVIFLVGALVVLPIKPFDEFLNKHKINLAIRIIAAIILFVVAIAITPDNTTASSDNPKDNTVSVADNQDNPTSVVDDKDSKNTDNKTKDNDPDGPGKATDNPNDSDEPADDPNHSDEPADDHVDNPIEPNNDPDGRSNALEDFYHGETPPNPVFMVEEFGNFKNIDKAVFETAEFKAKDLVGRWYEDGLLEGYYLELYGNGTWRYFGKVERNGTYWIQYSLIVLTESVYGVDVCQPSIFFDEDENAWEMSLTPTGPEVLETRTDSEDYVLSGVKTAADTAMIWKRITKRSILIKIWLATGTP